MAPVLGPGSIVVVGLRRVILSLGARQMIADTEDGPNAVEDSLVEYLLARK